MTIELPEFTAEEEFNSQGYEAVLPKGIAAPEITKRNLALLGAERRIADAPVWPTLLRSKLGLLLGVPFDVPLPDPDLAFYIYHFGETFVGPHLFAKSSPGYCHVNSIALWQLNRPRLDLVHGFCARGREWFRHSWCCPHGERQVVETSQKMEFYYGFRLPSAWARDWHNRSKRTIREGLIATRSKKFRFQTAVGTKLSLVPPPLLKPCAKENSVVE